MLLYWIWFAQLQGIPCKTKCMLLDRFASPEDLYHAEGKTLTELEYLTVKERAALELKDLKPARQILHQCQELGIGILTYRDEAFPARLRHIPQPPMVLYYKGILPNMGKRPVIAVVGTRKASPYGMSVARRITAQIAACGGLVVSGGAAGIDTMALHGAIDAGQMPVAVLGCGVDVVYPASNRQLFRQLAKEGCLISEYPPGTPANSWHFPHRNRIMSGMSNGVLVVEAPERSGALITARAALEQGRDVYIVPGNIDVLACQGSNALLQDGAAAVFTGYDVVREYESVFPGIVRNRLVTVNNLQNKPAPKVAQKRIFPENIPNREEKPEKKPIDNGGKSPYSVVIKQQPELSGEEQAIVALLQKQPQPMDDVLARSPYPAGKTTSLLTMLAIKGVVKNYPGGLVSLI